MVETPHAARTEQGETEPGQILARMRHAFATFLAVPTAVVGLFLLLAVASYVVDRSESDRPGAVREFLASHLFAEPETTTQELGVMAGGMITVTSITFSLLLVALQQSAGSMTHAVFDQFLRRRLNQFYAGWFIGITLYILITLATVAPDFNPIYGATLSLLFAVTALYVLLLLIYSAIEQMRPSAILESIHDHTLRARERQRSLLQRTRRAATGDGPAQHIVRASSDGFVTAIDLDLLASALRGAPGVEIVLRLPIGGYAAFQDPLAEVRGAPRGDGAALADAIPRAFTLERERDLEHDPAFGLEQIETIAWTTISTSKQDPNPGLEAVRNLRDLLARWAVSTDGEENCGEPLAIVYPDDVLERLMGTIESLTVVASESMQHHLYAEVVRGLATTLERLPPDLARRTETLVLRSLAGLGDHVLTVELDEALAAIAAALDAAGMPAGAAAVRTARDELSQSVGQLNSRSTRVPER
jgi:uncharacterized membrane protein